MVMRNLSDNEVKQHVENIRSNGFAILENSIDDDFLGEISQELDRLAQVRSGGDIPPAFFTGFVTRRWFDVLNDGDVWQKVAVHPWIMQIMPKILGDGFLLSTMGSAVIGPGEKAQPIHVDDGVYLFPRPHPNLVCNTIWALSEFSEEAGATRVVPKSNNWDKDPEPTKKYETIPLAMPKGSIGIVVGSLYHGAGANTTDKDRVGLTINYCNGSMRQQENLMMAIKHERMLSFSTGLQDILGFKVCKGAGHIFAQDPRSEMERHYGPSDAKDSYLQKRNELHAERLANPRKRKDEE